MSASDEHERAIEFARGALARARAHARSSSRPRWRNSRSRRNSRRWNTETGEPVYSGARADGRDPASLAAALTELASTQGWSEALTVAGVTSRWADIVGADVAEHVHVEAVEVGGAQTEGEATDTLPANSARIVLRADSTAWATQMRLLLPALRRRITEDLTELASRTGQGRTGAGSAAGWQVDVTVLAPSAPSWRKGARHVSGRGPRDTYG